jgi:hypothetical protein
VNGARLVREVSADRRGALDDPLAQLARGTQAVVIAGGDDRNGRYRHAEAVEDT